MFKNIFIIILSLSILAGCTACSRWTAESAATSDGSDGDSDTISSINSTAANDNDFTAVTTENNQPPEDISSDDIAALIDKNLDIIVTDPEDGNIEQEFIDAPPDEFGEMVALGEAALPYLNEIIENGSGAEQMMAQFVQYSIKPELYDLDFPSPDGKYTIKASRTEFSLWPPELLDYSDIRLVERSTGKVICDTDIYCRNIKVDWSPCNQYAALSHGILGYSRETVIVDVLNSKITILPDIFEVKQLIIDEKIPIENLDFYEKFVFILDHWPVDDKTKIQIVFIFSNPNFIEVVSGRYVYDLTKDKVTYIETKIDSYSNNPAIPYP